MIEDQNMPQEPIQKDLSVLVEPIPCGANRQHDDYPYGIRLGCRIQPQHIDARPSMDLKMLRDYRRGTFVSSRSCQWGHRDQCTF